MTADEVEALLSDAERELRQLAAERRAQTAQAKSAAVGKEPFDIDKLSRIYDLSDDDGVVRLSGERIEALEAAYYLDCPELKTLQEFADMRNELDCYNAG